MKPKIHYHSDCPFFAGCENMLVNFLSSPELRNQFEVSFSYRYTQKYADSLRQRVKQDFHVYPLHFPDPSYMMPVPERWPEMLKKVARIFSKLIFTLPIIIFVVWRLYRLFGCLRLDILCINNGGYPAALSARIAAIAARLAGVPQVVMVINNLAVGYHRPIRWLNYPLDRLVVRSISRFVTGSSNAARQLKKVLRLDETKCVVINNGISLRKTKETREETRKRLGLEKFEGVVFGVVAILRPNKGHHVLLKAMVKLLRVTEVSSNIKILIEGDGPLRKDLQAFVDDNQLAEHCVFVGDEKNIMDFMSLLDVLVLPSIDQEDFPNVILEAMGLGKPVIASCVAGIPEQVVDGETGMLVAPRDVDQLAVALTKLCLDKKLCLQMGQAGFRRFHEHFTAETAVKKYISLYQSLIESQHI